MIQEQLCPSCGRPLTLNMGSGGNFCLKCRFRWQVPVVSPTEEQTDLPPERVFTDAELRRLAIYRRAVAAGFFTDRS